MLKITILKRGKKAKIDKNMSMFDGFCLKF